MLDPGDRRFHMYESDDLGAWEIEDVVAPDGGPPPDLIGLPSYSIECRWEDLFCVIVRALARRVDDLWILDSSDYVWPGAEIDPEHIEL